MRIKRPHAGGCPTKLIITSATATVMCIAACQSRTTPTAPTAPNPTPQASQIADGPMKISNDLLDRHFAFEKEHRQLAEAWVAQKQGQVNIMNLVLELEPKVAPLRAKHNLTQQDQQHVEAMLGMIEGDPGDDESDGWRRAAGHAREEGERPA